MTVTEKLKKLRAERHFSEKDIAAILAMSSLKKTESIMSATETQGALRFNETGKLRSRV